MIIERFDNLNAKVPEKLGWIDEHSAHEVSFNVMPGKQVRETCTIRGYEVGDGFARAYFTRDYMSQMRNSPDHYIILTAQVQWQKLCYVYLCWRFGLPYDPEGREVMKIWATDISCKMTALVTDKDTTQDWVVNRLRFRGVRNQLGRIDVDAVTFTPGREIIVRGIAAAYLAPDLYAQCEVLGHER